MSQEESKIKKESKNLSTSGAIVVAGIIIGVAILASQFTSNDKGATGVKVVPSDSGSLVNKISSEDFMTGAEDPKVTIVEFSDFGCSFCARFHPTLQQVVGEYSEDVAWVYRHLPYRNKEAALASECVGQKIGDEAFWSYATNLFAAFPEITTELLFSEAELLGLSGVDLEACMADPVTEESVSQDAAEAQLLGATGTPFSMLVTDDGRTFPLRGAVSYEQVQQIIDVLVK